MNEEIIELVVIYCDNKSAINIFKNLVMHTKTKNKILKGTKFYESWYKKNDKFELKVYAYTDWVGKIDDRKITSGGTLFLGIRLI